MGGRKREESGEVAKARRLYARAALSYFDLEEAGRSLRRLQELGQFDVPLAKRSPDVVAHTVCLVVSYARMFSSNKGKEIAEQSPPAELLGRLDGEERSIHERLMKLRRIEFAHSDARETGIEITVSSINRTRIGMPVSRVTRLPFTESELLVIERLFMKVGAEISRLLGELPKQLPVDEGHGAL